MSRSPAHAPNEDLLGRRPDVDSARKWLRLMRRIDRVTISVGPGRPTAHLDGVSHRLPVRRVVHVEAALGLRALGVPTVVEGR
jgi:hypothetical protein